MKAKILTALAVVGLLFVPLWSARAATAKTESAVIVGKDEIINGSLYALGETVTVDGTISGDLITAAQTITVNGRVEGDIIAAGQDITINGDTGGNIRIAGNNLTLNGSVARNVNAFGAKILFGPDSRIGWDVYLAGAGAEMRGIIDGNLHGRAGQMLIAGKVGKGVNLDLSSTSDKTSLIVASGAVINGDLDYSSSKPADIAKDANIAGKVQQSYSEPTKETGLVWRLWQKVLSILSALAVGLVLIYFGKTITAKILERIGKSPLKAALPGVILMLVIPVASVLLLLTLVGIPLALLASAWLISAGYLAKIYTSLYAGKYLLAKIGKTAEPSLLWSLLLGVILCWLVFSIPYVGWFLGLVAIWIGLGGIYYYMTGQLSQD